MDQKLPLSQEVARRRMAGLFRIVAREGLHEGISNHFSYALSEDGQTFLMNPYEVHFSQMKSSDLLLIDNHAPPDPFAPDIDITAFPTGRPLSILTDEVPEKTAQQWEDYDRTTDDQQQHVDAMMAVLDVENPGYTL